MSNPKNIQKNGIPVPKQNDNPDIKLRYYQLKAWSEFGPCVQTWIMTVNYIFAILPGLLILIKTIYMDDQLKNIEFSPENEKKVKFRAHFSGAYTLDILIFVVFSFLIVNVIYQFFGKQRFLKMPIVPVMLLGQCLSAITYLLCGSESIVKSIRKAINHNKYKLFKKIAIQIIYIGIMFIPFLLVFGAANFKAYSTLFSEYKTFF